jgi:type IV pilus assembly protein PilA
MFCNQCGTQLEEGARFCRTCGRPATITSSATSSVPASDIPTAEIPAAHAQAASQMVTEPPTSPKALGSLISGIVGLTFIPVISSIVAIVLGHIGLSEIKKSAGRLKGEGMAIAGLVMGYLGIAFIPIILIIAAIAIPNLLRSRIAANESSAVGSIRVINVSEVSYTAMHPDKGFTCSLSELGPRQGPGAPSDAADLIDRELASGTKAGYNISLSNCESDISDGPVLRYKLVAEPMTRGTTGARTFCSDESGVIRFVRDASGEACLVDGVPL